MSQTATEVIGLAAGMPAWANEALCDRYAETGAPEALDRLVRDNQLLVHHTLKRFSWATEPYEDLVQVANVGLVKAAKSFDPARGARFSTYAMAMIDGEVRHHLRDTHLMRQPRWVRRVISQIDAATDRLGAELGRAPRVAEIARAVNLTEESVLEALALSTRVELHGSHEDEAEDGEAGLDRRAFHSRHYESFSLPIEDRLALDEALDKLSDFQRDLVELLFYREFTQREVADALGMTHKKVSREVQKTLHRLRDVMEKKIF